MSTHTTTFRRGRGLLRRGFTLLELMLALAITILVGVGICSMLAMVSQASGADADRRTALVRAHAAQVRLRAYIGESLCVLQYDPARGIALWLQDSRPMNNVHLSELRIVWFDADGGTVSAERLNFPDAWPQTLKDENDTVLPLGADPFVAMEALRKQGYTATDTLVDGVASFEASFDEKNAQDADRVTISLGLDAGAGKAPEQLLFVYGLFAHQKPSTSSS